MSNNIFDLLRTNNQPTKAAAPKTAAPKPVAKKAAPAPKAAAPAPAAAPAAAPATKAVKEAPKDAKDAKFSSERINKESTARQGDRKPRTQRPASDFSWKEGDEKPAAKSENKIGGVNRRERRAFEAKVADAADVAPQKRQFDRRSAHPAGEVKKGGFGKGNWGTPGSEAGAVADGEKRERRPRREHRPAAQKVEGEEGKTEESAPVVPRELTEEEKLAQEERERDAKLLTLKEYKRKSAADKAKIALPKPRAAGEGASADWSEFTVLTKEADTEKPSKKAAAAAEAATPAKVDEAVIAHSQSLNKKKQAEQRILSQLLKNNGAPPKNSSAPRRGGDKREARPASQSTEFGLVSEEFPSLVTKAVAVEESQ